jgi:hypothetical protein
VRDARKFLAPVEHDVFCRIEGTKLLGNVVISHGNQGRRVACAAEGISQFGRLFDCFIFLPASNPDRYYTRGSPEVLRVLWLRSRVVPYDFFNLIFLE